MAVLSSESIKRPKPGKTFALKQRTLLTKKGEAVEAGHPDGVKLLGPAGAVIPYEQAEQLGLTPKPRKKPAATKAKAAPEEDK